MAKPARKTTPTSDSEAATGKQAICGIIMPIAGSDTYPAEHWAAVRDILERSIQKANMEPRAVWLGGDAEIIHRRIIFNLHQCDFVICDVSSWNPNVMFELGIRLTFNKPTLVIADGADRPLFDIGLIEHIPYPRDLNFHGVEEFIELLASKLRTTSEAKNKGTYRSFIEELGPFDVVTPQTADVTASTFILEQLQGLSSGLSRLERRISSYESPAVAAVSMRERRDRWRIRFDSKAGDFGSFTDKIMRISPGIDVVGATVGVDFTILELAVTTDVSSRTRAAWRQKLVEMGGEFMSSGDVRP